MRWIAWYASRPSRILPGSSRACARLSAMATATTIVVAIIKTFSTPPSKMSKGRARGSGKNNRARAPARLATQGGPHMNLHGFEKVVSSEARLREVLGHPGDRAVGKERPRLD